MADPSQPSKPQVNANKPTSTRSLFNRVMEVVILVSNVCGYGPLSFRLAALLAFASSYLMRGLGDSDLPRPIVSGVVLVVVYYFLVGVYRLFVYNRFLDPLLGIPGPKVSTPATFASQADIYQGHWMTGEYYTIVASEVTPHPCPNSSLPFQVLS